MPNNSPVFFVLIQGMTQKAGSFSHLFAFQKFQRCREVADIVYSLQLPSLHWLENKIKTESQ